MRWRPGLTRFFAFYEISQTAIARYRPEPYSGPTVLVSTASQDQATRFWEQLLTGPHEVHRAKSDHHALLRPLHVAEVADIVTKSLSD